MNNKLQSTLFAALFTTASLNSIHAQDAANETAPAPETEGASEIGLQQVIETHDRPTVSAGYQFQYIGRTNPFFVDAPPTNAAESKVMLHTFMGSVSLNDEDSGRFLKDNKLGVIYQEVRYQEDVLESFDYDTLSAFWNAEIDRDIGTWTPSMGVGYTRIEIVEGNIDAFDGFFPYLALTKFYPDGDNSSYIATLKTSYGFTDVKGTNIDTDRLDSWTTRAMLGHNYLFRDDLGLRSNAYLEYSYFGNGSNSGRDDYTASAGTSLYYVINKYIVADLFAEYTQRFSSDDIFEYDNWDGGIKISSMFQF